MPRLAYTEDGEEIFVKTIRPLPVTSTALGVEVLEAMDEILNQLKFMNAQFGECFQTGIELEDIEDG